MWHSYFDGEADGQDDLAQPEGGVFEDMVPILVRGWGAPTWSAGGERTVPFLPSLMRARLEHRPLAWGRAKISRAAAPSSVTVPAGTFRGHLDGRGGGWPHHDVPGGGGGAVPADPLVVGHGEEASLLGSARMPYWQLNQPGGEARLKEMGLPHAVLEVGVRSCYSRVLGGVTVSTGTPTPRGAGRACYLLVNQVEKHTCQR